MLVLEMKIYGKQAQYDAMDEAIQTAQFIRNKALRYWMDNKGVGKYQLSAYCKVLAAEFPFAQKLNSMARQIRVWLEYFGYKFAKVTVALPPQYTSVNCSGCGAKVTKTLSTRTHKCKCCVLGRDENAARNILSLGLSTVGHTGSQAWGDETSILADENLSG